MVVSRKGKATVPVFSELDGSYQAITRLWCFEGGPRTGEHLGVRRLARGGGEKGKPCSDGQGSAISLGGRNLSKLMLCLVDFHPQKSRTSSVFHKGGDENTI